MQHQSTQRVSEWHQQDSQTRPDQSSHEQHSGNELESYRKTFSQDEIRVLKECNRESFYYRCLPLSVLCSGLAYLAMKNGYLKKGVKYGYAPKMTLGVVIGFIGGKLSYQSACAEKLMKLPNSNIGNALRKRVGIIGPTTGSEEAAPLSTREEYTLDLRDHIEGYDTYDQNAHDFASYSATDMEKDDGSNKTPITYDDLRRANRDDYNNKVTGRHKYQSLDKNSPSTIHSPNSASQPYSQQGNTYSSASPPTSSTSRNKYGDEWSA